MSKKVFESIMTGLSEVLEYERGNENAMRVSKRNTPSIRPVKHYSKEEIKSIRLSLDLSPHVFAEVVGVSLKTVEAWESGKRRPIGSSFWLLEIIEQEDNFLERYNISNPTNKSGGL